MSGEQRRWSRGRKDGVGKSGEICFFIQDILLGIGYSNIILGLLAFDYGHWFRALLFLFLSVIAFTFAGSDEEYERQRQREKERKRQVSEEDREESEGKDGAAESGLMQFMGAWAVALFYVFLLSILLPHYLPKRLADLLRPVTWLYLGVSGVLVILFIMWCFFGLRRMGDYLGYRPEHDYKSSRDYLSLISYLLKRLFHFLFG